MLNDEDTEAIICGSKASQLKVSVDLVHIGQSVIPLPDTVRDPLFFLYENLFMTNHIHSIVRSRFLVLFFNCAVWANYVSTRTEKLQVQLLCDFSCQGWTTATDVFGHAKEPATETTASPEHCYKICHSHKEVRLHHLPFSVSYTGYLFEIPAVGSCGRRNERSIWWEHRA